MQVIDVKIICENHGDREQIAPFRLPVEDLWSGASPRALAGRPRRRRPWMPIYISRSETPFLLFTPRHRRSDGDVTDVDVPVGFDRIPQFQSVRVQQSFTARGRGASVWENS